LCSRNRRLNIDLQRLGPNPKLSTVPRLPRGSKVLVTGATGFIGGRLVERLLQEQEVQVRCIIRNVRRPSRLRLLPVELVHSDLRNARKINRAIDGVDYVFHCAYDWRSRRQNIDGIRNLVEACASHSVKRLVHVSTFSVYEPFPNGPLTEESPDGDRSKEYVDTKLALEEIIVAAVRDRRVAATIVQPTIVYGPFSIPWTIGPAESLIFGEVILPDREEGLCNAIYIDDLVDGLILAAGSPAAVGERFIMSGPEPVTWVTFFTEIARSLGTNPPQLWPSEQIEKQKEQIEKSARKSFKRGGEILVSPRHLLEIIMSWEPLHKFFRFCHDALPAPLRKMVRNRLGSGRIRKRGEIFLPIPIYSAKATAGSEKARARLGYSPRFDFQRGMELTDRYLEWAYGDVLRSDRNRPPRSLSERAHASADVANPTQGTH
jgi:nucleoside-diphosphate-sugar epimerase